MASAGCRKLNRIETRPPDHPFENNYAPDYPFFVAYPVTHLASPLKVKQNYETVASKEDYLNPAGNYL